MPRVYVSGYTQCVLHFTHSGGSIQKELVSKQTRLVTGKWSNAPAQCEVMTWQ